MGADQPRALLAEPSGIVLWLWFEVAVGLSVVVVVLSALILGLDVDGAPPIPVIVALILGVGCLALAHQARSYRRTAGWVDVDDDGWDELRREAQSERDLRGWEELAPPPTAADVAAAPAPVLLGARVAALRCVGFDGHSVGGPRRLPDRRRRPL